ncbi:N-terminal phage integrase SAM-like domain-containing protein, partial [Actinotalea sp. AC32]|nr:N-terminal phage integrase SAM-like domain-containing protein [Actinotalea sp. AC32]
MAWVTVRRADDGKKRYRGRYRDASGAKRTVGTFSTDKAAMQAAVRAEIALAEGTWIDPRAGRITFQEYAEKVWLPSRHLEVTTYAAYASNLRIHFIPFFGDYPMARIMPALVQEWVNQAGKPPEVAGKGRKGLSARSIVKYH